jgi:DNA (cytosine-5)-methyltransferase 1
MAERGSIPVIDLFAGPGGLGEGFSALRRSDGGSCFKVRLSIEKDEHAHRTLFLRAFFRQFASGRVPSLYYDVLRGAAARETLFGKFPEHAERACAEAWRAELGTTPHRQVSERINNALRDADEWVLIGGPPCQAYSVAGRSRNKGIQDYRPDEDERQYLYTEYLQIIAEHWPAIFVMENVKGLLSATLRNRRMFDLICEDLASPARALAVKSNRRTHRYTICSLSAKDDLFDDLDVGKYVVEAERHGIPQARHRLILVGVRDDLLTEPGGAEARLPTVPEISTDKVLGRLPALRSGLSAGVDSPDAWLTVIRDARSRRWLKSARTIGGSEVHDLILETIDGVALPKHDRGSDFIEGDFKTTYEADWYYDGRIEGICNHSTREHMPSDLHRYLYAACYANRHGYSPKLRHFPTDLLPAHVNVHRALNGHGYFADRFRVQVSHRAATTITSHMAKDGHGFIHPDPRQCRSLTVREAARLQTFPDNYTFLGPRTQQYVQVGNAVPPLLASAIARSVWRLLKKNGLAS